MNAIEKYLAHYAEPVRDLWPRGLVRDYAAGVVVPAFDEPSDCVETLLSRLRFDQRVLVIFVVNAPLSTSPFALSRNRDLVRALRSRGEILGENAPLSVIRADGPAQLDLALVDLTDGEFRLKEKEGVGKARKWGFDLALSLFRRGDLASPYMGSTDADAILPPDYFKPLCEENSAEVPSALLYPYEHAPLGDARVDRVMQAVEASFRYHVLGLARARSPYAYPALGSSFAVHLPAYAEVRGVPNRQAGEDFHLLSKLAKVSPHRRLSAPRITLLTRTSGRVPFGTGPTLARALAGPEEEDVLVHHPQAFHLLGALLLALTESAEAWPAHGRGLPRDCPAWMRAKYSEVDTRLRRGYGSLPQAAHRLRRLHESFDALSSLQFLHLAESHGFEKQPLLGAVKELLPDLSSCDWSSLRELEEGLPEFVGPQIGY